MTAALGAHGPPIGTALPRTAVLLRALEARDAPFVLALDELEQLADPDAVAVLDALLRQAPPHLHVALAYRSLPAGLASARALLDAEILTADDLRFSRPDIARFFGLALPRRRLAADRRRVRRLAHRPAHAAQRLRRAAGRGRRGRARRRRQLDRRPFLARLRGARTAKPSSTSPCSTGSTAASSTRYWKGPASSTGSRRCPVSPDCCSRPAPRTATVYRLHPLLREHGAETMRRERPGRTRRLQRRIAAALARRGATVEAMRHAAEAGDVRASPAPCCSRPAACSGGCAPAPTALRPPTDCFSERAIAGRPRLALFRSVALHYRGRYGDAQRLFGQAASSTSSGSRVRGRPADRQPAFCRSTARSPCPAPNVQRTFASAVRIGALPTTSRVARGAFLYGMAGYFGFIARFDAAADYARRTRELVVGRSAYLAMFADSLLGELAMARGRVREARRLYAKARRTAHAEFLKDPKLASYTELMSRELAFERNRGGDFDDHAAMAREVFSGGSNLTRYPVAAELAIAMETRGGGADAGLAMADDLAERAHALSIAPCRRLPRRAPRQAAGGRGPGRRGRGRLARRRPPRPPMPSA